MDPEVIDTCFRLKLKVHFNSDIRIIAVERDASYNKLVSRISEDFGFSSTNWLLKYQDGDGDAILLTCQNDLNELVNFAKEAARGAIVVFVQQVADNRAPDALAAPTPSQSAMQLVPLAPIAAPPPRIEISPMSEATPHPPPTILRHVGASSSILRQSPESPLDAVAASLPAAVYAQQPSTMPRRSGVPHGRAASLSSSEPAGIAFRWRRGEQILGQGAFGTVYLGLNVDTGEMLAVKQLDTSDVSVKEMASLEHEISMLRGLHHGNIVRYYGTERTPDTLSILLEYVPGGSIRTMLDRFGPLGETVVRAYSRQLLLGLEYLHRAGNVLINTCAMVLQLLLGPPSHRDCTP
jgi:hypothetical protein